MLVDQPQPEIARSAVILGEVHVGAGAILAQGLVVRAHGAAVSIGNYSAILENGVVIGTPGHPVRVGQRTVFGHRATIVGATIGDLCEIGNGAILMPGDDRPGRDDPRLPHRPSPPCAGCNGDRNGRKKTPQQSKALLLDQALNSSRTCMPLRYSSPWGRCAGCPLRPVTTPEADRIRRRRSAR